MWRRLAIWCRSFNVHIVARFEEDPAWPGPIWGVMAPKAYKAEVLEALVSNLQFVLRPG